jgi:hypothetical protein
VILCPVCSSEFDSVDRLVRCEGCIWDDRAAASAARQRLHALRKGAGGQAYDFDGCRVCSACRAHFRPQSGLCPLVLIYNVSASHAPGSESETSEEEAWEADRFVVEAEEYWDTYLHTYDYPEHIEAYWRRLTQALKEPVW